MDVIVNGRQAGKTYALVQWVKEGEETDSYPGWSRVLLTHTIADADRLCGEYDLDYRQVFSMEEWRSARIGRLPVNIAVDNADLVLASYLGQMPNTVSITGRVNP